MSITATIFDVIPGVGSEAWRRRTLVRCALLSLAVAATLLATAGGAYAQTGDDGSGVDQYVEQPPSASGNTHGSGPSTSLPTDVKSEISSQGGSDASALETIVTNPAYGGAGAKKKKAAKGAAGPTVGTPGRGESVSGADPEGDVSATGALSSAVSAVNGGEAARLVGLLVVLFLISVATLTSAGLRQRRRAQ
jgi:hypothetical protein